MIQKFIVDVDEQGKVSNAVPYDGAPAQVIHVPVGIQVPTLIWTGSVILALAVLCFLSLVVVRQQSLRIVERFGKFKKIMKPGLNFRVPFIDKVFDPMDLKTQQLIVSVETKTKDNVFVVVPVAVQFFVTPEKAYDAFYKLYNPKSQFEAYIFDTVRAQIPKMNLDEVFEKKEDIAIAVKQELTKTMDDFGYTIVTALVTDINPAENVKKAMNEINAQKRLKEAAMEKGEGDKILVVKNAEAQSESKRLQGEGIAKERLAIVDGLEQSVKKMKEAGIENSEEVMGILLLTQYFDTMKTMGEKGNSTIFLPASPEGIGSLRNEITTAIMSAKK